MNLAARPICPFCLKYHMGWEPHGVTTIPAGVWEWPPGKWYRAKMREKPVSAMEAAYLKSMGVKVGFDETKPPRHETKLPVMALPLETKLPSETKLPGRPKQHTSNADRLRSWRAKRNGTT